jgi:hypothetical protein
LALAAFLIFVGGRSDADTAAGAEEQGWTGCPNPDACRQPSEKLAAAYDDAEACDAQERRVCLVPLGDLPPELVEYLVGYYRKEYDIILHVLPPLVLTLEADPERPHQLEAGALEHIYFRAYPEYYADRGAVLIGLTAIDIYTADTPEWDWFFGRNYASRAVISIYRMDPVNWGERPNDGLLRKRVRTLMNKYVAMSYYNLPLNDNPRSVLYRLIGSLGTLDRINERIPVPTPTAVPPTRAPVPEPVARHAEAGVEIARLYIDLLASLRAAVEARPPAEQLTLALTQLRDAYAPKFYALGCRTDAMTVAERRGVFEAATAYYDSQVLDDDIEWLVEAEAEYADPAIESLLLEIRALVEHALPLEDGDRRVHVTACPR